MFKICLLFIVAFAVISASKAEDEPNDKEIARRWSRRKCRAQADIVFLLDSPGSVGSYNFRKMLKFVWDITKNFQIGRNAVQVGVDTFSSNHFTQFYMKKYHNSRSLRNAINAIPYRGGSTNTGSAISYLRRSSFSSRAGNRRGVPDIAIVITDGQSSNKRFTASEAAKARRNGIRMFAIGIGRGVDKAELNAIASDPDREHVFRADNFNVLASIKNALSTKACQASKPPPKPNQCRSTTQADIVFVLDSSGSIGRNNYKKMLSFVKSIVKNIPIGFSKIRVGLEIFSTRPYKIFNLKRYTNQRSLIYAINSVPYKSGGTNTAAALKLLYSRMFTRRSGDRRGVPNIAIVVTDGRSNNRRDTAREAVNAQNRNINIFAVGVGNGIDLKELKAIASNPDRTHVMTVSDFSKLPNIKALFIKRACSYANS